MRHADVIIESVAQGGDGVGRLPDGRAVFVRGGCPGDIVTIEVTEEHARFARAAVVSVDSPSPHRVEPACPYFGTCGGCQWQHIGYEEQLAAKRRIVSDALRRIGHLGSADVERVVPSPERYGYRNRIELSVGGGASRVDLGFMRAGSNDLLPIDRCPLLPPSAAGLPKALAGALRFATSRGATGVERAVLRVAEAGQVSVDVWTSGGPFPRGAVARIITSATDADSISRVIVKGRIDLRDVSNVETLAGPGWWSERLGRDTYRVSPPAFFQNNTAAAVVLRTIVTDAAYADGTSRVADLYAGVGTFTIPLARAAGEVVAVEGSRFALGNLRENLERAGLDATVVPGDASYALGDLGYLDAIVVDPPRAGLSPRALSALIDAEAKRIVYVSCDAATLARDLGALAGAGYRALRVQPVDLFPQTYHVETVVTLERV